MSEEQIELEISSTADAEKVTLRNNSKPNERKTSVIKVLRTSFRLDKTFKKSTSLEPSTAKRTLSIQEEKEIQVLTKPQLATSLPTYSTTLPPPAPLVVEDPPSSDNASDLEDLKHHLDPAHLDGSSSNFGSAGARSAPSTPQGLLGSSPGGLSSDASSQPCSPPAYSIQRSPSHTVFTKYDKGTLKQLSTSTPAMTAQARSPEPPSPKAIAKEDKLPTTSKARQKKFLRHFPAVDLEEKVLNYYSCALIGDILLQGHLYITKNYFAFYSNVFGYVTKLLIPLLSVEKITKEKTARIIPNAVGIATIEDKHVFGSLISRDNTYRLMNKVWDAARNNALPVETELLVVNAPSECSDSSKSSESDNELTVPDSASVVSESVETNTRLRRIASITPARVLKSEHSSKAASDAEGRSNSGLSTTLRYSYTKLTNLPTQTLVLCASTLLLLLLFLSAAVLLYRIGKVQQKYILALQDNHVISSSEDVYGELLQWQAQLHTKSAGAVQNFLDSNLDQIAKVRQSLEALSTLLMVSESNSNNNSANRNAATEHIKSPDAS